MAKRRTEMVLASEDQRPTLVRAPETLGRAVFSQRKKGKASLEKASASASVGPRFLLELEHGKPTASLGKVVQMLERMGLELWVIPRSKRPGS